MKQFAYHVAYFSGKVFYGFIDALDLEIALLHVEQDAYMGEGFEDQVIELKVVEV